MENQKLLKNIVGWSSAVLLLLAYALLVMDIISHKSFTYNTMNLLAGIGLAWRVWQDRNYSNFVLELIFIAVAIIGLLRAFI